MIDGGGNGVGLRPIEAHGLRGDPGREVDLEQLPEDVDRAQNRIASDCKRHQHPMDGHEAEEEHTMP